MPRPDPDTALSRFLGFDPEAGLATLQLPDEPAPRLVQLAPQVEALPVAGSITLKDALDRDAVKVLRMALERIFQTCPSNAKGHLPPGGRYGHAQAASASALRWLGHKFATEARLGGWIVGKQDDADK